MKKIYKWSIAAISTLTPVGVLISCGASTTSAEFSVVNNIDKTVTTTANSATLKIINVSDYVGKKVAISYKARGAATWKVSNSTEITQGNKNNLTITLSELEALTAYDVQLTLLEARDSTVYRQSAEAHSFFTTKAAATPNPGDPTPPVDPTPPTKIFSSEVDVISTKHAQVLVKNADEYVGKQLKVEWKSVLDKSAWTLNNYFDVTKKGATSATLTFKYLEEFVGNKLKVELTEHVDTPPTPAAPSSSASSRASFQLTQEAGTGTGGAEGGAGGATGTTPTVTATPSTTTPVLSSEITVSNQNALAVELTSLTASKKYDLKVTVVKPSSSASEDASQATTVKELGTKPEALETLATGATEETTAVTAPVTLWTSSEQEVTAQNKEKLTFDLKDGLNANLKFAYRVLEGENVVLPYSEVQTFSTPNSTSTELTLFKDVAKVKIKNILPQYEGRQLTVKLIDTTPASTSTGTNTIYNVVFALNALVQKGELSVQFHKLRETTTYSIQVADPATGQVIPDFFPEDYAGAKLTSSKAITTTEELGPNSVTIKATELDDSYKGKNLVLKYVAKVAGYSDAELLKKTDSVYEVTASVVTDATSAKNSATFQLNNYIVPGVQYLYQVFVEGEMDVPLTNPESKTFTASAKPAEFRANGITLVGNSASIVVESLTSFQNKKLILRAVKNPMPNSALDPTLVDFFPEDENSVKLSVAVDSGTNTNTTLKLERLESNTDYVFQLFVENEKNPLLSSVVTFRSNQTPNTLVSLKTKNSVDVKVTKLDNLMGKKIRVSWATKPTAGSDGAVSEPTWTDLTGKTIEESNKNLVSFEIGSLEDGKEYLYKLSYEDNSTWIELKQDSFRMLSVATTPLVGGVQFKVSDAQLLVGSTLVFKYKKSSDSGTTYTAGPSVVVDAKGVATGSLTNLSNAEKYTYQLFLVTPGATADDASTETQLLTKSESDYSFTTYNVPVAATKIGTDKITVTVLPLYNLVGTRLKLQYRKQVSTGTDPNPWTDISDPSDHLVKESNKVSGVVFDLYSLEGTATYEFRVVEYDTDKVVTNITTITTTAAIPAKPETPAS